MQPLSLPKFIIKRLADDWKLLLSIFLGILLASTLIAGAPVYFRSLQKLGLNTAIDRAPDVFLNIFTYAPRVPLSENGLQESEKFFDGAIQRHASEIYRGHERYVKSPNYLIGLPHRPLSDGIEEGGRVSRGYFRFITNLDQHVSFIQGRMASDDITQGAGGPALEAVVGTTAAAIFQLNVGDDVIVTPSLSHPARITVKITGILEPNDRYQEFWQYNANIFLEPEPLDEPPDEGLEIDPAEPPLPLFITQNAMVEGLGKTYPGTLVTSNWFVFVSKEGLKKWSISDSRSRLDRLESEVASNLPGSAVLTGIRRMTSEFERRSFFTGVPLLLLMAIMVMTVFYYLFMMVSYLVQSREDDIALLRSRGVSTLQLLRIFGLEGLMLTSVAVMLAPFLAMGLVAVSGTLPYFREITGGGFLPVQLHWIPFAVAAGTGLASLAIFILPGLVGARTGLIIHRLRSSRPPSTPIFQRFYLDVGLLIVGGLVFWELRARGQFVSAGLFESVQVNEALLIAPVLFLLLVGLVFLRVFPLFVRFISGDSPVIAHLLVVATMVTLAPIVLADELRRDSSSFGWIIPVGLVLATGGVYWATHRAQERRPKITSLVVQAALVATFVWQEPLEIGALRFGPTIGLILIVPVQLLFLLFRRFAQAAPVWVTMSLWHMARNPLQYSWLVLLLVLVTGLGVLSTTVGGTLNRSYQERVLYDVAADIRVTNIPGYVARGTSALESTYLTIPGVVSVSLALRGQGALSSTDSRSGFEVLAVQSQDFERISWYRDDFSAHPLGEVMGKLQPGNPKGPMTIPDNATSIGVWAKPEEEYPNMFLWMVIQDDRGVVSSLTLGNTGAPEWHLMSTEIPRRLQKPLQLVSVQIFEPAYGPGGTAGRITLDDIHVDTGMNGDVQVLEDFEFTIDWIPLATSALSTDNIRTTSQDAHKGRKSGVFTFGKDTDRGIRGFYRSPNGGPVPVVASAGFLFSSGTYVGDSLIVNIFGRLIPVQITDAVNYFPTMHSAGGRYLLADLDSLLRHINILSPRTTFTPNELFIAEASGAGESVYDTVLRIVRSSDLVQDKDSLLTEIRLDPLITVGWRALTVLSLGIIIVTAGLGYVTYILSFAGRSRSEVGFLRSLGLSRRQTIGLLTMEHVAVVIIGLGLGTWAGFQMSRLMVSAVAVTERGNPVIPPFILTTNWGFLLPVYAVLIALFVATLYILTRSMLRLDFQAISRSEGN